MMTAASPPVGQEAVFALLDDPATYGGLPVRRIDTHISAVFIAGERVLKLKRAVRLSFLNFTSLDSRAQACWRELEINRRTAPELYLGLRAVTRQADGRLALDGDGAPVDWLVEMVRFDEDGLFDRLAAAGALTRAQAVALADVIAEFHAAAAPAPGWGGAEGIRLIIDGNAVSFSPYIPALFSPAGAGQVTEGALAWLTRLTPLLNGRAAAGLVRRCHGDLHLGNICLWQGRPTLFDAIEFCDDFACIDVFYDLAFLLMDLQARGLDEMASWVLNRYLERTNDLDGLAALPLFLSLRAAVRAHVSAAIHRVTGEETRRQDAVRYLERAAGYLSPPPPRLLAVGGLSGCGKSRLARDLAPWLGAAPGAVVLRSDVIRKRLLGVAPETRLPAAGYAPAVGEQTYGQLCDDVARALQAGQAVIADAVFAHPEQRAAIEAVATRLGLPFTGLWLEAAPEVMRQRVASRQGNASDATVAVLDQQLGLDLGEIAWTRIDSSGSKAETLAAARTQLSL